MTGKPGADPFKYAISKWPHHFLAFLETESGLQGDSQPRRDLGVALNTFADHYDEEVIDPEPDSSSAQKCAAFEGHRIYYVLQSMWSHIHRHESRGFIARNEISLKQLKETIFRNRETVITHHTEPSHKIFAEFYGSKLFKCPKLTCYYFHEGFNRRSDLRLHCDRHDHPFRCTVSDCPEAELSFSWAKDVEKHNRTYHLEVSDLADAECFAVTDQISELDLPGRARPVQVHAVRQSIYPTRSTQGPTQHPHRCENSSSLEVREVFRWENDQRRHVKSFCKF